MTNLQPPSATLSDLDAAAILPNLDAAATLPDLDAAAILAEMLAEAGRGPAAILSDSLYASAGLAAAPPIPLWLLLDQDGAEFVTFLYEEVLGRPPDAVALAYYEGLLAAGRAHKLDIAGALRYSAEGRRINRKVTGLLPRYLLRRTYTVPVLGRLARLFVTILRLPRLAIELQQATRALAEVQARLDRLERKAGSAPALTARLQQTEARLGAVEASLQPAAARLL